MNQSVSNALKADLGVSSQNPLVMVIPVTVDFGNRVKYYCPKLIIIIAINMILDNPEIARIRSVSARVT